MNLTYAKSKTTADRSIVIYIKRYFKRSYFSTQPFNSPKIADLAEALRPELQVLSLWAACNLKYILDLPYWRFVALFQSINKGIGRQSA